VRLIEERVGQRGLKGFCPVVLRDQRELADANPAYCSVYHAQRYYFSSAEAKARFDTAPQKYAPAAGGLDVVVKSNTDQAVDGSLDFALWYKDRLYLFCSPESLHAFSANPTAYAAAVARLR
jgi:YHS domain-containing protein